MSKEQKVGLFFVFGVFLAAVAVEITVGTGLLEDHYHLYVNYRDVQGLKPGDQVRVAGVLMGKVDEVSVTPAHVRVRIQLNSSAQVRRDSTALLDFQAMSGSRFIAVSLGSPEQALLKEGDTIAGKQVAGITDMIGQLERVGTSVTELSDSLNRNQDELLRNVNTLITENQDAVRSILASLQSLTDKLESGEGTIARLINDPSMYDQAENILSATNLLLADLREVSRRVASGQGSLGRFVVEDDLYDELREVTASLNVTMRNLEELSSDIREGHGTLGRLVNDDTLYLEAQNAVRGLDRAATGIEDVAPIAVMATFVSTLF